MTRDDWPPIPRIWEGATACLFGAGPSLTPDLVERVRGRCRTIAVNGSYRLAPWADVLYACSANWWSTYQPVFEGIKVTQDVQVTRPDVIRIPSLNQPGLARDQWHLHTGGNGVYQALNLAVHLGAKTIILLGCDMRLVNGKTHFHPDHLNMSNPTPGLFTQWIKNFRTTIPDLAKAGCAVINCTPGSALDAFPLMDLEDALNGVEAYGCA